MEAEMDFGKRVLKLSNCSAEEVRLIVATAHESEIVVLLHHIKENLMSLLDDSIKTLTAQVAQNTTVSNSALALIQGIPALIDAAIAKAQAAGATPAQLQAITDLSNGIKASDDSLAAAVSANTPGGPVVTPAG